MKVSTKGRYALRLMLALAQKTPGEYTSLRGISVDQDISIKYLEQITGMLSKAGFIKSSRGAQGGYMLAKEPDQYTVGDVLKVTEGSMAPVACLEGDVNTCPRAEKCITLEMWEGLYKVITDYLDGITLQDLLDKNQEKAGFEYMI